MAYFEKIKAQGIDSGGVYRDVYVNDTGSLIVTPAQVVSFENSTTTPLSASNMWSGSWEDVSQYSSIAIFARSDVGGTLFAEFSIDGIQTDRTVKLSSGTTGSLGEHELTVVTKYYRNKFINGNIDQSYFRLQTLYHTNPKIAVHSSRLNQSFNEYTDILNTRASLFGKTDGGHYIAVPVTPEGHVEVAIHGPRNPFGSIHVENLTPVFQTDAVYSLNPYQINSSSYFSGNSYASNSMFVCETGTTLYSQASIQSKKRLRYRPGQGVVGRVAGLFTQGVNNSYQVIGFGHAEDGVYFGYKNAEFGILYSSRGKRQINTLNVTTPSTTNESLTVTLNGVTSSVVVTNSGNVYKTAYEIASSYYKGWKAEAISSSVMFVSDSVGLKAGIFNITGSTATGSFSLTQSGSNAIETFVSQSDWNGDKMNGSGSTGLILDPTKGNVFQFGVQYLGFGALTFYIESSPMGNNSEFINVHTIQLPNTLEATSFGNPSFPFTMAAYSAGSTSNLTVKAGSFAGFIEGKKYLHGNRFSYENVVTDAGATAYRALFTVQNYLSYKGRANQAVVNILDVSVALKHNQPASFYLIKNAYLTGTPIFSPYSTNSCTLFDTSGSNVLVTNKDQILWIGQLSETSRAEKAFELDEEITLQPGEWITLACKTSGQTVTYAAGSINTREDQ